VWVLPPDGFRIRSDSLTLRAFPRLRGNFMFVDSMLRTNMDTMRLRLRGMPGGIYGLSGDSLITFEPGNFGIAMLGMRAVGGAELTELNPGLGSYFGAEAGVLVVRVAENTPADHAGLQAGDVIVSANGHDVTSVSALHRAIGSVRPRQPIRLEILRKKVRQTIELRED
jgi:hypothetical protein